MREVGWSATVPCEREGISAEAQLSCCRWGCECSSRSSVLGLRGFVLDNWIFQAGCGGVQEILGCLPKL